MKYKELVKRLREIHPEEFKYAWVFAFACQQAMHEAADAIEELIAALTASNEVIAKSRPKWIPVTERIPEKREYVLVRYKNNDMAVACWFDGDEDILFWRAMTDEAWCADCDTAPTHWMPLPEPPEEDE